MLYPDGAQDGERIAHRGMMPRGVVIAHGPRLDAEDRPFHSDHTRDADIPGALHEVVNHGDAHSRLELLRVGHGKNASRRNRHHRRARSPRRRS